MTFGHLPDDQELIDLVESCLDDTATAAEWAQLNERLRIDPAARKYYLAHLQVHASMLRALAKAESEEANDGAMCEMVGLAESSPWRRAQQRVWQMFRRPTPLSMTVAALVVGLLVTGMAFVAAPIYRNMAHTQPEAAATIVARVLQTADAVWAKSQPLRPEQAKISAGERLELVSGLVEIEFQSGARVVLQGPAVLSLGTEKACHLDSGALVANVPPRAVGFTVQTFAAELIDLGTEFGVRAVRNGSASVEVFEGQVEVRIHRSSNEPLRHLLYAGDSLQINPHSPADASPIKARGEKKFVRAMPTTENQYASPTPYSRLVESLKPALYFRMEPADSKMLFDSSELKRHGLLRARGVKEDAFVAGVDGQALNLRGPELGDCAVVARYPFGFENQLSCAAWVYVEEPGAWANIATHWGDSGAGQFHFGLRPGGDLAVFINNRHGIAVEARQGEGHPLPRKSWQHVAFVASGETLNLYVNGQRVASTPCDGITTSTTVRALAIGTKSSDDGARISAEPAGLWSGKIDEFAIFHRALSDEEIQRLFASAPLAQ